MKVSRRTFVKYTAGSTLLTLFGFNPKLGIREALAAIPGPTLDPLTVPKYVMPLLIPPAMPQAGKFGIKDKKAAYYEIAVRQFRQQILPRLAASDHCLGLRSRQAPAGACSFFNAPSLTIEARQDVPTLVKWINELVDEKGTFCRTCCRSIRRCTGPTRPAGPWAGTRGPHSTVDAGPPTRARCPSSRTSTAWRASATRATATPRPGTCRTRRTSRPLCNRGNLVRLL